MRIMEFTLGSLDNQLQLTFKPKIMIVLFHIH
jgi:hypothetical protein